MYTNFSCTAMGNVGCTLFRSLVVFTGLTWPFVIEIVAELGVLATPLIRLRFIRSVHVWIGPIRIALWVTSVWSSFDQGTIARLGGAVAAFLDWKEKDCKHVGEWSTCKINWVTSQSVWQLFLWGELRAKKEWTYNLSRCCLVFSELALCQSRGAFTHFSCARACSIRKFPHSTATVARARGLFLHTSHWTNHR